MLETTLAILVICVAIGAVALALQLIAKAIDLLLENDDGTE